jgi:hypothetical protein
MTCDRYLIWQTGFLFPVVLFYKDIFTRNSYTHMPGIVLGSTVNQEEFRMGVSVEGFTHSCSRVITKAMVMST